MNLCEELKNNVKQLCNFGIRFAGSKNENEAAKWIYATMKKYGLLVEKQKIPLMGWKLEKPALLSISYAKSDSTDLECLPLVYSASTPEQGVEGELIYIGKRALREIEKFRVFERDNFRWNKYAIVDKNRTHLAHIISRDYPFSAPVGAWGALSLPNIMPTVLVSEKTGRLLKSLMNPMKKVKANLFLSSKYKPNEHTYNITGSNIKEGNVSKKNIIIAAHYDSQYNTIGAVDNASGVSCLLALASRWKQLCKKYNISFVAFGAEELGLFGSKYYVNSLKEQGKLDEIKFMLNLDMLGCNSPNWFHISDNDNLFRSLNKISGFLNISKKYGEPEYVIPPWPTGDQNPFFDENIPTVSFTWKGSLYQHIHRPEDSIDKIKWEVLIDSFYLAEALIDDLII